MGYLYQKSTFSGKGKHFLTSKRVKYATCKDVTLNITNMDKINTVSSQVILVVSSFARTHARSLPRHWSVYLVKTRLFKTAPNMDELPFQFIHTMDLSESLVDTTLHDSPLLPQSTPTSIQETLLLVFLAPYPRYLFESCKFFLSESYFHR